LRHGDVKEHMCTAKILSYEYVIPRISDNSLFVHRPLFSAIPDESARPGFGILVKEYRVSREKRLKEEYNLCETVALTLKKQMI